MSHTPGPWCVDAAPSNRLRIATTTIVDHEISADEWGGAVDKVTEARANARLIAAAPELREAVERLLYVMTPECDDPFAWNGAIDAGEAALAKAREEEQQ